MNSTEKKHESSEGSLYIIGVDPIDYKEDIDVDDYEMLLKEWQIKASNVYASKGREDKVVSPKTNRVC